MTFEPQMILIFGATGDLVRRKLIPALYHLEGKKRFHPCTPIVCVGRRELSIKDYFTLLNPEKYIADYEPEVLNTLLSRVKYCRFDMAREDAAVFAEQIKAVENAVGRTSNKLIYLALPTTAFEETITLIGGLGKEQGWRRVVFEKPFGSDLHSARILAEDIRTIFTEDEVYRVDHYLGKELVQNILTLRFDNEIFSGAWSNKTIDNVQITVSETLGVEQRAGYYEKSGAIRDMVQNHLLQLLSFVAMESPEKGVVDGLRDQSVSVLKHLRPPTKDDIVLGQYCPGSVNGNKVVGYTDEQGVAADSTTETYVALRAHVDTPRWQGVPFYLRTGKRLGKRYADIKIVFRRQPQHIVGGDGEANVIIIRIQPDAGIALVFNVQKPGEEDSTTPVMMDFCHSCHFGPNTPEAYESILYNVMEGDHNIFPRRDWIEASWEYIDQLRAVAGQPVLYESGSNGPIEAEQLLLTDNHRWLENRGEEQESSLVDLTSKVA